MDYFSSRFIRSKIVFGTALIVGTLAGCSSTAVPPFVTTQAQLAGLYVKAAIPIPNTAASFAFDVAAIDPALHRFYLADATDSSLDVVDTTNQTLLRQITGGFAGLGNPPPGANLGVQVNFRGPDGVVPIPGTSHVYVGNIGNVKLVDEAAGAVLQTIAVPSAGVRTDEGCYDPDDNIVMFQNPADAPPFATWISTTTNAVVARYSFTTSAGLEACVYDRSRKSFLLNNDATPTNPTGELDVIPAASVVAGNPVVSAAYPLPNCTPGAMALGKNEELGIACFGPETLIVSATTGQVLQTITNVGGSDAIDYDPVLNRFYVAAFLNGTAANGSGGTPVLGVIDAGTMAWIGNIPTTPAAHSVAVDPTNGYVYVPLAPQGSQPGTITVYAPLGK